MLRDQRFFAETTIPDYLLAPSGRERDLELVVLLRGIRDLIDGYLSRATVAPVRDMAPSCPAPAGSPNGREHANGHGAGKATPSEPGVAARPAVEPPPAQPRPSGEVPSREDVRRALLDEYVRRTGYPEEMLDPQLDLEAELGIDTVKQVAALAAVRERFALPQDPTFKLRDANTLAKAIEWLAGRLRAKDCEAAEAPPDRARGEALRPPAAPARSTPEEPGPRAPTPSRPTASADDSRSRVLRMLVEEYARRTGYPQEMLAPDLDLEAELGIDTIKQVAALAAVRERLGLPRDTSFKLRDVSTMAKAADALARRLVSEKPQGASQHREDYSAPAQASSSSTGSVPLDAASSTGATAAPHDEGRSPPHGIHSVTARLLEGMLAGAAGGQVREVIALSLTGVTDAAGDREPLVHISPLDGPDGALHLRAKLGAASSEATVRVAAGAEPDAPVEAPREILAALASGRRTRAASGDELRATLAPILGSGQGLLEWARSDGFMVAVGGATLPEGDDARRSAAVLASAAELASFAWMGLTGAPHALSGVEQARFHGLPVAGAEVSLRAKMVPPEGGLWRADVLAVSGGSVVAEIRGLAGTPISTAALPGSTGEAAERAWRRFCRRMRGEGAGEGVA